MTTRDFKLLAKIIRITPISQTAKRKLIEVCLQELPKDNPLFDPELFRKSCMQTSKHQFVSYPGGRYPNSCVRCGKSPLDAIHQEADA